jgi:hypothetical protein
MNSTEDRANAYTSERRRRTGERTLTRANAGNERTPGTREHRERVSAGNERVERTLDERTPGQTSESRRW